ncbi:hypothetical protein [Pseudobacteriovorax antillogorgiicola]|uniref:Uncharacterized protein n=1 Tax=Pseudobacteriovorax antillogorgiicola TaxID=1513793 RepID=A0A1Y6B450_9BACT|nr:hypothetical protein [Pseudobacteriovorax antillogorgiicola]TCS59359.1 hypothetical protein EDD56_101269 [Pseudobacteriovorax antillogorgiicola]SME89013.1 hypothetical protein SAMN06296036_101217 [Pseudobacteriovorax antillogorgiicola]
MHARTRPYIPFIAKLVAIGSTLGLTTGVSARIYTGTCQLAQEPIPKNYSQIWPNICIRNHLGVHYLNGAHLNMEDHRFEDEEAESLFFGRSYLGLNFWHSVTMHFQGLAKSRQDLEHSDSPNFDQKITEYAFLQLGNPTLSPIQASVGKIDLPFGLNDRPLETLMDHVKRNYWPRRKWGLQLSKKNNNQTRYEIGVSLKDVEGWQDTLEQGELDQASARASIDLAALEGTKLIASFLTDADRLDHYSMAILNRSQGAFISLEWVRQLLPEGSNYWFHQLFRLNYLSKRAKFSQWLIQFEDDRKNAWLLTGQWRLFPTSFSTLMLTVSHRRSFQAGEKSKWFAFFGTEVNL